MKKFILTGFQIYAIEENFLSGYLFLLLKAQNYRITFTFDRLCVVQIEGILSLNSNAFYMGCTAFPPPLRPQAEHVITHFIEARLDGRDAAEQCSFLLD